MSSASEGGREASRRGALGRLGWRDVAKRMRAEIKDDNVGMLAAGVAFYAFLALFPALAALVSIYGLVADSSDVEKQILALGAALPAEARGLVRDELHRLTSDSAAVLGWRTAVSLGVALWAATKGMISMMQALDVAYDVAEQRSAVRRYGTALLLTAGAIVSLVVAIAVIAAAPLAFDRLGGAGQIALALVRWPLFGALLVAGLGALYRYGPSRERPRRRWVTPGSLVATALLLVVSMGFSLYVGRFGSYDKTYGSLGAVAVLLVWLDLGAYAILVGAELDAGGARQTQ